MRRGHVRYVFAGTNSAYGFHSFFDGYITDDVRRIFLLKGGPGSGKSTFMRKVAEALLHDGYNLELLQCSADSSSIDGFFAPEAGIVMLDGTAPHVIDPHWPGAIDEIIDLDRYSDSAGLTPLRDKIVQHTTSSRNYYKHAYNFLAAAKIFLRDIEAQVLRSGALDEVALNIVAADLINDIFGNKEIQPRQPKIRRLLASAITPEGFRNHLDSIFDPLEKRYILRGHWGTGKGTILRLIYNAASVRGYDLECFYCALDPHKLEHMIIHPLGVGIITSSIPHLYVPRNSDIVIDTAQVINAEKLAAVGEDIGVSRSMYGRSLELALGWLARAQKEHQELEALYAHHVRYEEIDKLCQMTIQRVREYCR